MLLSASKLKKPKFIVYVQNWTFWDISISPRKYTSIRFQKFKLHWLSLKKASSSGIWLIVKEHSCWSILYHHQQRMGASFLCIITNIWQWFLIAHLPIHTPAHCHPQETSGLYLRRVHSAYMIYPFRPEVRPSKTQRIYRSPRLWRRPVSPPIL